MDSEPKQKRVSPLTLVLIIIIILLAGAAVVLAVGKLGGEEEPDEEQLGDANVPKIGYEEGITVVDDPDAFQKAVDEINADAEKGGIPIEYRNDAHSSDGRTLECYIGNPANASYDIYINIFFDDQYTDQLYLSGLIPPGKAMKELRLDHDLPEGDHRVFMAITQVEDDHATIRQQAFVTMDFHVEK